MSYLGDSFRADLLSYTPEQPQEQPRKGSPGLMSDIARGTGQFVSGAGSTLRDLGAEGLGSAIEQYGADVVRRNPSEISSLGDVLSRPVTTAREAVGEMAPQVGLTLGGALGGRVLGGAIGALGGPLGIAAGQQIGGYIGGLLPAAVQTYGGIRSEQREQGIDDRLLAGAVTIPAALLERFGGAERLAMKVAGEGTEFLARGAGQKLLPAAGRQFVRGGLEEAITEIPQTALERVGAYKDLTSDAALDEYGVAGAKAVLGGGVVRGGLSAVAGQRKAPEAEPTVTVLNDGTILQNDENGRPTDRPITVAGAAARRPAPLSEDQFTTAPVQYDMFRGAVAARGLQAEQEADLTAPRGPDLRQQELFMPGGQPTYGADASFSPAPLDRDRMAELQDRVAAATQRGDLTAEQGANLLQNILAADRAGVQWQNLIGERTAALLGVQDVGQQGAGLVSQLEREQLARDRGLLAAQRAGAGAQALPGMVANEGTAADFRRIMDPTVMQSVAPTTDIGGAARSTRLFTPTSGPTSQLADRPAPAAAAPQVVSPPSGAPAVPTPAAPVAAGGSLPPAAPKAPAKREDESRLAGILQQASRTNTGSALEAKSQGQGVVRVPGKTSLTTDKLRAVRDALLSPEGTVASADPKLQEIADSVRAFAKAYSDFEDAGGNAVRTPTAKRQETAIAGGQRRGEQLGAAAENARTALERVGAAVGGNAKDVEAVVSLVKTMVQQKLHLEKGDDTFAKAFTTMDTMLSRGWNAAKQNMFRGDTDRLYVRQSKTDISREAKQAGGTTTQLERAAGGTAAFGKGESYSDLMGMLTSLRQSGTPMERLLAKAVRESMFGGANEPKVEFITEGNNRYDPKSHTVYLHRDASPAVVLHEALHAALQRYVYQNQSSPTVQSLLKSLDAVVAYKGPLTGPAKEVQDLLKKLVKKGRTLDAALELVSYGNTLNEFRRAMDDMKLEGAPKTFADRVSVLWNSLINAVRGLLGGSRSVATDVIMDSLTLLREASTAQATGPRTGNVLEAAVQSTRPLSDAKAAAAIGVSEQDYSRWAKSNLVNALPTQRLFESVGLSEANAKKFVGAAGTKFADMIRKNFPGVEIILGLINSRFSVPASVSQLMDRFKLNKGIGYQYAEDLANVISRRPADEVNALFAYLDGNTAALDKFKDADKLKANADKLKQWFDEYVAELSDVEQRYFKSRKFSETLLFPERTEQVAGGTFGLGKINEVLGLKRKSETELDQNWFTKDENGDLLLDGDMFQVFKIDNTVKPGVPEPSGFMSAARFAELGGKNPIGYSVDTTRKWLHEGASDEGHSFITNTTAREKLSEQKADDVANALRNTIAALANNYASKHFIKSVSEMGQGDNPHAQVAYDSLEAINKDFGTSVTDDKVLKVSYEMSRSPQTQRLYRQSGTWVKLPESKVYGALAGKYLPGPVWNAMIDMSDRQPITNVRAVNATMRWFKKSKTVWNPGTHVTNAASNVTMAMLHDISFGTMRDAAKLLAKYETGRGELKKHELDLIMAFRDSGAMLADYSSAEVKEALYKAHAENLRGGEDTSVARRVAGWMGVEKAKAEWLKQQAAKAGKGAEFLDSVTSQLYAAEDNIFRLAAFLKTAGTLQTQAGLAAPTQEMLAEAGKFARVAFGDYDIDSKAVKIARQSVMPFISWFYAMAPVIGRIAVYQPWKLANVLAAYMLLEGALGAAGGDDEELRKKGPESIRERLFFGTIGPYMHVRIPFMGDDQNPVYYKLGDYFPMASMTKGLPNGFMGQSWFPGGLTPGGPFVSGIAGLVLGVDPYTGKSIHKPTDDNWDKLWNATKFGYDIATPPAISSRQLGKAADVVQGKTGVTGVEPSSLVFARMFGLKLYDFNVDEQAVRTSRDIQQIKRDFKAAMTKAQRDEMRKGHPDFEALDAELNDLRTRMQSEIEKARGGAEE